MCPQLKDRCMIDPLNEIYFLYYIVLHHDTKLKKYVKVLKKFKKNIIFPNMSKLLVVKIKKKKLLQQLKN